MDFIGSAATSHGVTERRFDVTREGALVPGIVWTPEGATGARPLVLVGHGGSANKRTPYVLSLARRLVRHAGYAVAAIDAPHHGDRVTDSSPSLIGSAVGFREVVTAASDGMVADWTAALAELQALEEVGEGPLGYWGVSMGTMLGAPFVAATPSVRCAVLGLMGTFTDDDPWTVAARAVGCPVLFLVQTDDELIPTEQALSLFRSIGAADKRLHAHPGAHSAVPPEEMEASEAFFARHLT